jgi:hypothetical protein
MVLITHDECEYNRGVSITMPSFLVQKKGYVRDEDRRF